MKDNPTIVGSVHKDRIHESAIKHVTGQADYSDDIALPEGALHGGGWWTKSSPCYN